MFFRTRMARMDTEMDSAVKIRVIRVQIKTYIEIPERNENLGLFVFFDV